MRTRLKICGITRPQDADQVVAVGADGLGLIFYPPSPRYVEITAAAAIAAQVPPLTDVIAVFVNPSVDQVDAVLQRVAVSVLQFHGDESAAFCNSFGVPYIKTLRVSDQDSLVTRCVGHPDAGAVLLDTHDAALYGGTGRSFPWHLAREVAQVLHDVSDPLGSLPRLEVAIRCFQTFSPDAPPWKHPGARPRPRWPPNPSSPLRAVATQLQKYFPKLKIL